MTCSGLLRTAFVIVLVVVAAGSVAGVGADTDRADGLIPSVDDTDGVNGSVAPGERLMGAIRVQAVEHQGEINRRAFRVQVARASSNRSRAAMVRGEVLSLEMRVQQLAERKAMLEAARDNGSISEGRYQAEVAALAARAAVIRHHANDTEAQARDLPPAVAAGAGLDVTRISTIRERAGLLRGPAIANIARQIAGPGIGTPITGPPRRVDAGPPDGPRSNRGNGTGPPDNRTSVDEPPADNPDAGNETSERGTEEQPQDGEKGTNGQSTGSDGDGDGTRAN